jgi:outer membrane protein assembly factor BamB
VRFDGPRATPTVDGDRVFTSSLEGHLFCFDAASGKVLWSLELPRDLKGSIPVYGYCCSPLVHERMLIFELNAPQASYAALDKSSGAVIWKQGGGDVTCGSPALTTIDGLRCVVSAGGGSVVGLGADDGRPLWRHGTWGHMWMGPVVDGDKVFVANASLPRGCGVIQVQGFQPKVLWEDRKKFQTLHSNAVIWKGHIYGVDNTGTDYQGSDSKKSSLKCIALETGEVRWAAEKMGWGNLIVFDEKLVCLREAGELVVAEASPDAYKELLRVPVLGGRSWTVPALAGGKLYCRNNAGDVVCLRAWRAGADVAAAAKVAPAPSGSPREVPSGGPAEPGAARQASREGAPAASVAPAPQALTGGAEWPRFRGPGGLGIAPGREAPVSWNIERKEGLLWRASVPLPGESSPILRGQRVFLSGAAGEKLEVWCFDAGSGKLLWQRQVEASPPRSGGEPARTVLAASTGATDGARVYHFFGTGDLACLDLEGGEIWTRSLGAPDNMYGHGSSLEVWKGLLFAQLDQGSAEDGKSRLLALEGASGRTVWEARRSVPSSWSSPAVMPVAGRDQLITCADPWVISYDPSSGEEIWRAECLGGEVVPSPICAGGLVVAASVDGSLAAIRADGRGDVTKTHIAWTSDEDLPGIASPVSDGDLLFVITTGGHLTCRDLKDGRKLWARELETSFQASPSLAGGCLFLPGDQGEMFIFRASRQGEMVARLGLGESCQASPAFREGRMYLRTKRSLLCLGAR